MGAHLRLPTGLTDLPNAADPEHTVDHHIPTGAETWRLQALYVRPDT